jgi:hypothetical protein
MSNGGMLLSRKTKETRAKTIEALSGANRTIPSSFKLHSIRIMQT